MDKQAILYWGVGSAVAVYLIVKMWQLVRRWSLARAARAQREARHAQLQVVHAPAAPDEPSVPRRHSRAVWPQERRAEDRVNPFEELGQEYPYADDRDYTFGGVTPAMAALVPASEQSRRDMSRTLKNAGYYSVHAWRNYQAVRYLGIVLPLMFFGALLIVAPERLEPVLMLGLLLGPMLGWALPAIVVRGRATERLHEMHDLTAVRDRHLRHYLALAERAESRLRCAGQRSWLTRLDAEAGNLRAALDEEPLAVVV